MSDTTSPFALPVGAPQQKPDIDDNAAQILAEERGDPVARAPLTERLIETPIATEPPAEPPAPKPPAPKPPRKPKSEAVRRAQERLSPEQAAESVRLTIPIPDYLHSQLKDRAHMTDATVRHVVLTALRAYAWKEGGEPQKFFIRDADMGADRRKKEYRSKSK